MLTHHRSVVVAAGCLGVVRVAFEFGPADAAFVEEVIDTLPSKNSPMDSESDLLQASSAWDGSDSWIRKHFQVRAPLLREVPRILWRSA